jgi:hypothetical protein
LPNADAAKLARDAADSVSAGTVMATADGEMPALTAKEFVTRGSGQTGDPALEPQQLFAARLVTDGGHGFRSDLPRDRH